MSEDRGTQMAKAAARARRRLLGVRVLCVSRSRILLVRHEDPHTGESYWVLPGGGREPGEAFEEAAVREVREETGLPVRLIRRLRVPGHVEGVTYALYLAEPLADAEPIPQVDLSQEMYLRAAAWHSVDPAEPLGPLSPSYWGYLAPRIRALLR